MPTYYVSGHSPSGHHRARSYSQSYQPAPQVVYTSPRDTRRSTSNRDHNHGHNHGHGGTGYTYAAPQYVHHNSPSYAQQYSTGNGGVYYASSAPAAAQYGTPAVRYTTSSTHHRSHSVPRRPVQVVDARRHHQPTAFADSGHHRRYSYDEPSVGDRLRHFFGFGPSMHHEPSRRADYRDPRTGRTVDWRGRPIYRV